MTQNKDKRLLKREPKLKVQLNEEQKQVIADFYQYDVNFILGDFGSGKSLTAVYAAIAAYRKKQFNKIWITRPMLKNNLAALPGTVEDKMFPYIYPIIQNLEVCQGKEQTIKMRQEGEIEIMPIDVAKGVTFIDSVVIVDEFQDMDYSDFRTILTRLGKESKIIFCGSIEQVDKSIGRKSCIHDILKLDGQDFVGFNTLTANHRNDSLTKIIRFLENEKR
jgi:phosphate starvation-inducible PhoH-like protein